ncbi:hypothetical protein J6590_029348 [Homalodisca vitripennis]|nr:hypothetical protein J6590_029348 [Homalodisca vitripennis]
MVVAIYDTVKVLLRTRLLPRPRPAPRPTILYRASRNSLDHPDVSVSMRLGGGDIIDTRQLILFTRSPEVFIKHNYQGGHWLVTRTITAGIPTSQTYVLSRSPSHVLSIVPYKTEEIA